MMRAMRARTTLPLPVSLLLSACTLFSSSAPQGGARPPPPSPPAGEALAGTAAQPGPGETPYTPAPRTFRLSAATSALVAQAHHQLNGGDYEQAAATLERALRIEPDNPLVWIELGRVRLDEKDAAQADALGRRALTLATGDPAAQEASWRLIADALRARGRNQEAGEAERQAGAATR